MILTVSLLLAAAAAALTPADTSWRYYRPGNTGVMGDISQALWVAPDGAPYVGGYDEMFEEGGFARFDESLNRWENFSNVDFPVIGSRFDVGSCRITDFCPDGAGGLWLGTWKGALHFDPAQGGESLVRYDSTTSLLPGGRTTDISVAPDGTVWFSVFQIFQGPGGVVRYDPATDTWTQWGSTSNADGWPGWGLCHTVGIQPDPAGGYRVWVQTDHGVASYHSLTGLYTVEPYDGTPGQIMDVMRGEPADAAGNVWMAKASGDVQNPQLGYRDAAGVFHPKPAPYSNVSFYTVAFHAYGDGLALAVNTSSQVYQFNGTSWSYLGVWRSGGFTYDVCPDGAGGAWVAGVGGVAHYSGGSWQRYRITNTGFVDNFAFDLSLAPDGDVWVTGNAAPGIGGIAVFDGKTWTNFNSATYGIGHDFPFDTDNADRVLYRESTGTVVCNPTFEGLAEWDGAAFDMLEPYTVSMDLVEDSLGRLWTMGEYFSLRYRDATGFHSVGIDGWGVNVDRDPSRPGTVWACSQYEVKRTDGQGYEWSRDVTQLVGLDPQSDGLLGVAAGPDGVAWVGSSNGLYRLDAENGLVQRYHPTTSDLPGANITPLLVSPDGVLWMTNFDSEGFTGALVWFDGVEFGSIGPAEGLPHAQIWDSEVRSTETGYELWLSCASRGLGVLSVTTDQTSAAGAAPARPAHLDAFPNPFNPSVTLSFAMERAGAADLDVFDLHGRRVRTLLRGAPLAAGRVELTWDGRDGDGRALPSGVYMARLRTDGAASSRRLVLAR
ncbi:MAG TPA: FlgD immunoglobulin-like domain containing protein [Candidatus Krumholzibacteria bacterium]|nr:FlgD immunoglobulin-like domain containing protein [Candidatus Krumholzibacteria bacterium]